MRVGRQTDRGFILYFLVNIALDPHPNPLPERERGQAGPPEKCKPL